MAKQFGWAKWTDDDKVAAKSVIKKLEELFKKVNFPEKLKGLGFSRENLEQNLDLLVNLCFQDASGSMSPRLPSKTDFENIYRYAYEGKDIDF